MSDQTNSEVEVFKSEEGLLLDHDYDGIRELDHSLPRWWLWLLYATIVFAAWYAGYYMSGMGPTPEQELALELARIEASRPVAPATTANDGAELLAALNDPAKAANGAAVFAGKCVACHGDKAQGGIGPNLADDFWINGEGRPQDVSTIVAKGVAEKGMPPWGEILTPVELRDVVVFIHSVRGTNPAGAKAPQGNKFENRN